MKRDQHQKPQDPDFDRASRKLEELRRLIQEGVDSGPSSPLDMTEVKREAHKRRQAMQPIAETGEGG